MEGKPLEESLSLSTYYLLALVKLRQFTTASELLISFGDLDSPRFQVQTLHGEKPFSIPECSHSTYPNPMPTASSDRCLHLLASQKLNPIL